MKINMKILLSYEDKMLGLKIIVFYYWIEL